MDWLHYLVNIYRANPLLVSAAAVIAAGWAVWNYGEGIAAKLAAYKPSGAAKEPDTVELVRRWQALLDGCAAAKRPEACRKLHELFPALQSPEE
jgi:hypothetical protein